MDLPACVCVFRRAGYITLNFPDAYRRAARRAAWKDPEDHGAFNPFAGRGPQRHVQRTPDTEAGLRIRTDTHLEAPETVVETTQAELDAENKTFAGEVESDGQIEERKSPVHITTVPSSGQQEPSHSKEDVILPTDGEVMPDDSTDMNIIVKTLTGKSLKITVRPVTTILELKELIENKEGTPPDQQRIITSGEQRLDGQSSH